MKIRQIILVFLLVAVASGWAQTPAGYEYGLFLLDRHEWDKAVHEFDPERSDADIVELIAAVMQRGLYNPGPAG